MVIQVATFQSQPDLAGNLDARRATLEAQLNSFLSSFVNRTDILAVDFRLVPVSKYDEFFVYLATVTYKM